MKKKRICFVISTFKKSGPINIVFNIVKFLDKDIFDIHIVALSSSANSRLRDFELLDVKTFELNNSRIAGLFKNSSQVKKLIYKNNIDIIHTHGLRADALVSFMNLKTVKHVTTLHNFPFDDYPMKFGATKGFVMAKFHFYIIKKIKHRVSCSKSLAFKLIKTKSLKTKIIQNGVDLILFKNDGNKNEVRQKLNIPLDKKVFIYVGSLIPRKNPLDTIKNFTETSMLNNTCLIILGDGFMREESIALMGPNIIFRGNVANVSEYLSAADYFVSQSKSEGLPNTVMEALAMGLPVVLSNIQPHIEILEINKKAGIILKDENFCQQVNNLLESNYNISSKAAYDIVSSKLNANNMAIAYAEYYLENTEDV